jgi:hypothetical protein
MMMVRVTAAILDYFINLDKEEAGRTVPLAALPVKVTGTAGNLAGDLYRANAASGNFDTVIGNLYVRAGPGLVCVACVRGSGGARGVGHCVGRI